MVNPQKQERKVQYFHIEPFVALWEVVNLRSTYHDLHNPSCKTTHLRLDFVLNS